jgi:hypothetical protein
VTGKVYKSSIPRFLKEELAQIALTNDNSYGHPYIVEVPVWSSNY